MRHLNVGANGATVLAMQRIAERMHIPVAAHRCDIAVGQDVFAGCQISQDTVDAVRALAVDRAASGVAGELVIKANTATNHATHTSADSGAHAGNDGPKRATGNRSLRRVGPNDGQAIECVIALRCVLSNVADRARCHSKSEAFAEPAQRAAEPARHRGRCFLFADDHADAVSNRADHCAENVHGLDAEPCSTEGNHRVGGCVHNRGVSRHDFANVLGDIGDIGHYRDKRRTDLNGHRVERRVGVPHLGVQGFLSLVKPLYRAVGFSGGVSNPLDSLVGFLGVFSGLNHCLGVGF